MKTYGSFWPKVALNHSSGRYIPFWNSKNLYCFSWQRNNNLIFLFDLSRLRLSSDDYRMRVPWPWRSVMTARILVLKSMATRYPAYPALLSVSDYHRLWPLPIQQRPLVQTQLGLLQRSMANHWISLTAVHANVFGLLAAIYPLSFSQRISCHR